MCQVHHLKVSLLWTESQPDLLLAAPPAAAPMGFLASAARYAKEFDKALGRQGTWTPPWPPEGGSVNRFWKRYLGNRIPDQGEGARAWEHLVPLRLGIGTRKPVAGKLHLTAPWLQGSLQAEGFFYPHGLALVITISLEEDLALAGMIDRAVQARAEHYQVTWPDGGQDMKSLDLVAEEMLDHLRTSMLGPDAAAGPRADPFAVSTVIRGAGVDATLPVLPGSDVHQALEGLCSWHATWQGDQPHDLDARSLEKRNAPEGHVLYGLDRGRAVWFPASFLSTALRRSSLGCYHRNLTLVSLQTESLLRLVAVAAEYLRGGRLMPVRLERVARLASEKLGLLYGGSADVYRSASPPVHIDDSGLRPEVDRVRQHFAQAPLPP